MIYVIYNEILKEKSHIKIAKITLFRIYLSCKKIGVSLLNHILHRNTNRTLPKSSPLSSLHQLFATYFSDIITKLFLLLQLTIKPFRHSDSPTPAFTLSYPLLFIPATLLEITNFMSQSSNSSCDLHPIPTTVLK